MERRSFREAWIGGVLKEAESGARVSELFRLRETSNATFYTWRSKCAELRVPEMPRLDQFEEERWRLHDRLRRRACYRWKTSQKACDY